MTDKFDLKQWMHSNGAGPYKLHENYIDFKAIGSLKEEEPKEEEEMPEEPSKGRPPHATSIEPWWDKEPKQTFERDGLVIEVSPNREGSYSVIVGGREIDQKFKSAKEAMSYLDTVDDMKSLIKGALKEEEDEDIPYAEEIPDEEGEDEFPYSEELPEEDTYELGKNLHAKTQRILNKFGAKVINDLTVKKVADNIEDYRKLLGKLKTFKTELRNGTDLVYDYLQYAKPRDEKVVELDKIHGELEDDSNLLDDIIEVLDNKVFLVRNGWNKKGLSLGQPAPKPVEI